MVVDVVVEIPTGSQNKYEVDHATGRVRLDRVLFSPMHYPTDYGFVEDTLAEDGDPLDAMVVISQPTFPGCVVRARIVGMLEMRDEKGVDHKLLGVAADDPRFAQVENLDQLSPHLLKEIAHFFSTYKALEAGKSTDIGGWRDKAAGERLLAEAQARYRTQGSHP